MRAVVVALLPLSAIGDGHGAATTCGDMKKIYRAQKCCGRADESSEYQIVPMPSTMLAGTNVCEGKKPTSSEYDNKACMEGDVKNAVEQAGTDVTEGYMGKYETLAKPITSSYLEAGLCPVNVHWHLGAEHRSDKQFDEDGVGPAEQRRLASGARRGFRCHHYDASETMFTKEYDWQHCEGMKVGETYEVHWPHSKAGACGTPNQYQSPFYDGVFCRDGVLSDTASQIGVQAQVFTIVNDENYYYPDLIRGMIVDGEYGQDIAKYTGSTTGTSRNNEVCSAYSPITWQVDRKCNLISASTFDKMCADMKSQRDDMSSDLVAHGARELVDDAFAANNHERRLKAKAVA